MPREDHKKRADYIWSICNKLRGPYHQNEYRKVILPLTVLRRFDCVLEPTKQEVLKAFPRVKGKAQTLIDARLCEITGFPFYNTSKLTMSRLLDDPDRVAPNLTEYINRFSPNVRAIMERFNFGVQVAKMDEKGILYEVIASFVSDKVDLSKDALEPEDMGYVFEELIRIGAEKSNEESGDHFTPREIIKLMVNLLLSDEPELSRAGIVKAIYDPACGTGGMLSMAENYIKEYNKKARLTLVGQDWNDESWAICKSDMLIKGSDADNIHLGDSFTDDKARKMEFDYMLANPPFGVEWKQQQKAITKEHKELGMDGRFGAGLPRVKDGSLLFLQHMISKMRPEDQGGCRIGIVFNGSPLFTGDAVSPTNKTAKKNESSIRQWILENDLLEAIIGLPDQLFFNTGISTYIWLLTNKKEPHRVGKVQLIDARHYWEPQRPKSLGDKRKCIGDGEEGRADHIGDLTKIHGDAKAGVKRKNKQGRKRIVSNVYDNEDFGYRKVRVERPLRLNFQATPERLVRLVEQKGYLDLAKSNRRSTKARLAEIAEGEARQQELVKFLELVGKELGGKLFKDRKKFLKALRDLDKEQEIKLRKPEVEAILGALGERDKTAEICRDSKGHPEPDKDLADDEIIPLKEDVDAYFECEVKPHVPDAWMDRSKDKIGYEIPFNRKFYVYEPPRPLKKIEGDIERLEKDILELLKEVVS